MAAQALLLVLTIALAAACSRGEPPPRPTDADQQRVPCVALEPRFTAGLELTAAEIGTLRKSCERIGTLRWREVQLRLDDADGKPLSGTAVER